MSGLNIFNRLRIGCKFFAGQWHKDCNGEYNIYDEPEILVCTHPNNESTCEGNCNFGQCPIIAGNHIRGVE